MRRGHVAVGGSIHSVMPNDRFRVRLCRRMTRAGRVNRNPSVYQETSWDGLFLSVGYLMSRVQCRGRRAKGIGVAAAVHLGLSDAFVFVMHEAVDVSCRVVSLTSLFARRTSYSSSRLISITASSGCEREHSTATLARRTL